jgi:hypothetical protein
VILQRLDGSGTEIGPEVEIHQNPDFAPLNNPTNLYPKVTALEGGGYAAAFLDNPAISPAHPQLRLKIYDTSGRETSDTVIPNPQYERAPGSWVTTFHNSSGSMTPVALEGGGVALIWSAGYPGMLAQYAGQTTNYVQHINADGTLDGAARQVTPWVASVSYSQDFHDWVQDAAPLEDGGYVMIYRGGRTSPGNDIDQAVIMAQTFDAQGMVAGSPFVVAEPASDDYSAAQTAAKIAVLSEGGFVVIWHTTAVGIQGQRFDAAFNPVGETFTATGVGAERAMVSATPDGGFIITAKNGLYVTKAMRFDADGVAVGDAYEIATRALFPGVSHFGGSYNNSPGHWEFAEDGTGLFFVVGSSFDGSEQTDVWVRPFQAELFGTQDDNILTATDVGMALHGLGGNDLLTGGRGDDLLAGGEGDDTLVAGHGDDTLLGGDGIDRARFGMSSTAVNAVAGTGGFSLTSDEGAVFVGSDVEFIEFADRALSYAEATQLRLLRGTDAAENIIGSNLGDRIEARGGNDWITPGAGHGGERGRYEYPEQCREHHRLDLWRSDHRGCGQ